MTRISRETRVAVAVFAAALALGILFDALFHGQLLGLNVLVWTAAFVGVFAALLRAARAPLHQGRRFAVVPALLFSGLFAWHESPLLVAANLLALAAAVALAALRRPSPRVRDTTVLDYVGGLAAAGCATISGAVPLLGRDVAWSELRGTVRGARVAAVGRGLVLGVPLVALFGGLFVAADAVFADLVGGAVPTFGRGTFVHSGVVLVAGWLTMGLLRDLLAPREDRRVLAPTRLSTGTRRISLGGTEVAVAIALLDLLFLAFVAVQFRYLFGGASLVRAETGLTYAEYARRGFFELVVVAALALPLLLLLDWMLRRERRRDERLFRALAGILVVLLFVVMASALQRMRLYMDEYGLTQLRVYATGVILWLAAVLVWLAGTVLRGRRRRFAAGALVSGLAATLVLNVVNPDALIARTNLSRPKVDVPYLARLSDDAVPTLVERVRMLPAPQRRELARELLAREHDARGWRSWTASRSAAARALREHRADLWRIAFGR